jgi:hypothetical protein
MCVAFGSMLSVLRERNIRKDVLIFSKPLIKVNNNTRIKFFGTKCLINFVTNDILLEKIKRHIYLWKIVQH